MIDQKELREMRTRLTIMWAHAMNDFGWEHPMVNVLSQASMLLIDAERMAENPYLRPVQCIVINGNIHAATTSGKLPMPLCGEADLNQRIESRFCVPTCPECQALIRKDFKKPDKPIVRIEEEK